MPALHWSDVLFAWLAMMLHLAWCARLDDGLARRWLWSSVRAAVQLLALGYVLLFLFDRNEPGWTALAVSTMLLVSSWTVAGRVEHGYRGLLRHSLLALGVAAVVVVLPLGAWLGDRGFFNASFLLPTVGILIGNSVSGISLGVTHWLRDLHNRRGEIEFWLAMGATPDEAIRDLRASVLRTSMTVVLNAMAISGLVSIPGQLSGQVLAGANPVEAVKYQLILLFLMAAFVFVASWVAIHLSTRRVFDRWGALTQMAEVA